jgi:hypothetical protein
MTVLVFSIASLCTVPLLVRSTAEVRVSIDTVKTRTRPHAKEGRLPRLANSIPDAYIISTLTQ